MARVKITSRSHIPNKPTLLNGLEVEEEDNPFTFGRSMTVYSCAFPNARFVPVTFTLLSSQLKLKTAEGGDEADVEEEDISVEEVEVTASAAAVVDVIDDDEDEDEEDPPLLIVLLQRDSKQTTPWSRSWLPITPPEIPPGIALNTSTMCLPLTTVERRLGESASPEKSNKECPGAARSRRLETTEANRATPPHGSPF